MATTTKNMQVTAGNANASVTAQVTDSMPGVPCPGPGGYVYKGLRYVPLFSDPIEWNSANSYEALTIVIHEGNSYTSKQAVPVGVDISNETFWALTGNYNAQVEQYRQEVAELDNEVNVINNSLRSIWYTVDNTMSVNEIQNVLNNFKNVKFASGVYSYSLTESNTLFTLNNGNAIWLDNAEINLKPTSSNSYDMFLINSVKNVEIFGGKIIGDAITHTGEIIENQDWGYGIGIYDSENVNIHDIEIDECWGDSICIYTRGGSSKNNKVYIKNAVMINSRRQGISLINGENVIIENCLMQNIGANGSVKPGAGIDIEPEDNAAISCIISNCKAKSCSGAGLMAWSRFGSTTKIDINNCYSDSGFGLSLYNPGYIKCSNSTAVMTGSHSGFSTACSVETGIGTVTVTDCYVDVSGLNDPTNDSKGIPLYSEPSSVVPNASNRYITYKNIIISGGNIFKPAQVKAQNVIIMPVFDNITCFAKCTYDETTDAGITTAGSSSVAHNYTVAYNNATQTYKDAVDGESLSSIYSYYNVNVDEILLTAAAISASEPLIFNVAKDVNVTSGVASINIPSNAVVTTDYNYTLKPGTYKVMAVYNPNAAGFANIAYV